MRCQHHSITFTVFIFLLKGVRRFRCVFISYVCHYCSKSCVSTTLLKSHNDPRRVVAVISAWGWAWWGFKSSFACQGSKVAAQDLMPGLPACKALIYCSSHVENSDCSAVAGYVFLFSPAAKTRAHKIGQSVPTV